MARRLRLFSWNVLADANVRPDRFTSSDPSILQRRARGELVLQVAASFDADAFAFQEADEKLAALAHERLTDWDVRWSPKGSAGSDGCLTAVRHPWRIAQEHRLVYGAGDPTLGAHAHVLVLLGDGLESVALANTHFRWAPPKTNPDAHLGVSNARQLVDHLMPMPRAVIAADTNDRVGGSVRQVLAAHGFVEAHGDEPTAIPNGTGAAAIDLIAARGIDVVPLPTGIEVVPPLPRSECPSDHLPLLAALSW